MKPILAFETSSPELSIALFTGEGPVLEETVSGYMNHAEKLLPVTDQLLKSKNLTLNEIDTFLIGRGPGSFTGLRVGYATLKGFLTLDKKNCFGALSLDLIAERVNLPEGSVLCVVLDAHREKVYSRFYTRGKEKWEAQSEPQTTTVEDWIPTLPKEVYLTGDGTVRYREAIEKISGKKIHALPEQSGVPRASTLIQFYQKNPELLQKLSEPKDFVPLYFRLSEAEERYHEKTAP